MALPPPKPLGPRGKEGSRGRGSGGAQGSWGAAPQELSLPAMASAAGGVGETKIPMVPFTLSTLALSDVFPSQLIPTAKSKRALFVKSRPGGDGLWLPWGFLTPQTDPGPPCREFVRGWENGTSPVVPRRSLLWLRGRSPGSGQWATSSLLEAPAAPLPAHPGVGLVSRSRAWDLEGEKDFCGEGQHRAALVAIFLTSDFKVDLSLTQRWSGQTSAVKKNNSGFGCSWLRCRRG